MSEPPLFIITGATATGKSARAVAWARENDAEIVSCDSLLVYRGMDIGTAKPSSQERAGVPHHCIDIVEPSEAFSVAAYITAAKAAICDISTRGKRVVVVGGSGFYLRAFYGAVTDDLPIPQEVVDRVRALQAEGLEALQAALEPFAPGRPDFLDWRNPRRVAKALERCMAGGMPLSELHARFRSATGAFAANARQTLLLERAPEDIAARIERRTRAMISAGLVEEVVRLRDLGVFRTGTPPERAIGYKETLAWLAANRAGGKEALLAAIVVATRQLVAKQRKWFRSQIPVDETIFLQAEE
ncbi:MAG: tRNA (adenosine(37)-N6)-dimethylallyltransferase MiaA [Puniceicoccales bacterium]|nr:tRNA (adenosine(37)-N6)-dimethylallyltransferase MiaA [Puniceicoccales bacterium]